MFSIIRNIPESIGNAVHTVQPYVSIHAPSSRTVLLWFYNIVRYPPDLGIAR